MFILNKTFTFEAAHKLPFHDGKCSRLHGHSWRLKVEISGKCLRDGGHKTCMLIYYGDIKTAVNPILEDYLDHHYLNDTTGLDSPTSELLAKWIYLKLQPVFDKLEVRLTAVEIEETCTSSCRFSPDSQAEA